MSKTLDEFTKQVNVAIPYLKNNNERLKVDTDFVSKLESSLTKWNELNDLCNDPKTRTPVVIHERNELRVTFEKDYNFLIQSLKHSTFTTLTSIDKDTFGIKDRKKPTSIPAPSTIAKVDIIGRLESTLIIQVSDPASPDLNYTRLPKDVDSINVFVAIVEANAPEPADEDYHLFTNKGKSNIELKFDTKDEKKVAYIRASFVNKAGSSRMSDPINSVIPN